MVILLAGILLILQGLPCTAEEIIIVGDDYKPPKIYMENEKPEGILVEILRYVEKETDYSFKIDLYPWKRAYVMAENGGYGIIGLSMTKERLQIFDFSEILYYDDIMLVVKKGHEFTFNTLKDLKGKLIGARRGASYGDKFELGAKKVFELITDNNGVQRLKKVLAGRIDAALIGPGKAGLEQVLQSDPQLMQRKDEFVILEHAFKRDPNYLGFAKTMNMKKFLEEFNLVLQKGYKDGTIQQIIDSYQKQEYK